MSDSCKGVNETIKCVPVFVLGRLGPGRLVIGKNTDCNVFCFVTLCQISSSHDPIRDLF